MDNYGYNSYTYPYYSQWQNSTCEYPQYITMIFERFPLFFAEKRYKLINFAPEMEIVDNLSY